MKGTRPLTNKEIRKVRDVGFTGEYAQRDRGFFMLNVSIGGRVSEMLALTVGDVWQNGQPVSDFQFDKEIVKGGETSRTIPVNADGRKAIEDIIAWHREGLGLFGDSEIPPDTPLFLSQKGGPLKRQAMHKILKNAFKRAGLNGKLATHTPRKTFAQRLYDKCNDIFVVKEMLGHKNVATTQAYLGVNYIYVREAVEAMSLDAEDHPKDPLDDYAPEMLVAKVIELGYKVEKAERSVGYGDPNVNGHHVAERTNGES